MFIHTIAKPNAGKERKMASKYSNITVKGFRRENGRVGVRTVSYTHLRAHET